MTRVSQERARWLATYILPHEGELRAWLRRKPTHGLEIDDLVQETYAKLSSLESVADIRNPRTYAFSVAYSLILTHIRRAQVVSILAAGDLGAYDRATDVPSPEEISVVRDDLHRLADVIGEMPPKMREVFLLRRVEGFSQREIAQRLGISEKTVENHVGKAITLLMAHFGRGGRRPPDASRSNERESGVQDGPKRDERRDQ